MNVDLKRLKLFADEGFDHLEEKLDSARKILGDKKIPELISVHVTELCKPELSVPLSLSRFIPLIHDGIVLLLANTPWHRLKEIVFRQLQLNEEAEPGNRLVVLARCYPVLQKLAQIIARRADVDKATGKWLSALEEERDIPLDDTTKEKLLQKLYSTFPDTQFILGNTILARASVAELFTYSAVDSTGNEKVTGVMKILKSDIRETVQADLEIIQYIFEYFEKYREKYDIEKLDLSGILRLIEKDILRETDLTSEQRHLNTAGELYKTTGIIQVPTLHHYCSSEITSMSRMAGCKITEFNGSTEQITYLSSLVFEEVICKPLFTSEDNSIFHGDPHGGNILASIDDKTGLPSAALVDWSLTGVLSRTLRIHLTTILVGLATNRSDIVCRGLKSLTINNTPSTFKLHESHIHKAMKRYGENHPPLQRSFHILQYFAMKGYLFSPDLLLFRKTYFTLEGVLSTLSKDFNANMILEKRLTQLLISEFPQRIQNTLTPGQDRPEKYKSMLATTDLFDISVHGITGLYGKAVSLQTQIADTQIRMWGDLIRCFTTVQYHQDDAL